MAKMKNEIEFKCSHKKINLGDFKLNSPLCGEFAKNIKLVEYFMYLSPVYDKNMDDIYEEMWNNLYDEIIKLDENLSNFNKVYARNGKVDYYKLYGLEDNKECIECNRWVISRTNKENNLAALLRHIRNCFAHGLVYSNDNEHMLLKDKDEKNITAKIVINKNLLSQIKEKLENAFNNTNEQDDKKCQSKIKKTSVE